MPHLVAVLLFLFMPPHFTVLFLKDEQTTSEGRQSKRERERERERESHRKSTSGRRETASNVHCSEAKRETEHKELLITPQTKFTIDILTEALSEVVVLVLLAFRSDLFSRLFTCLTLTALLWMDGSRY